MKITLFLMTFVAMFTASQMQAQPAKAKKILVAYYSYGGNTRAVAQAIAAETGGDLFEIVPAKAYPKDHDVVVDQARKEITAGVRPALKADRANAADYDVIFVGSPCWWATIAPPVATFLAGHDFKGRTIIPFMTHEGSRMGHTEADIRKLCPGAVVTEGFPVRGSAAKSSQEAVSGWIGKLNLKK